MSTFPIPSIRAKFCLHSLLAGSALLTLTACGGGSSSSSTGNGQQTAIQGEWQAECEALSADLGARSSIEFEGSSATRSDIFYVGSDSCSNGTNFTVVADASFTFPSGTTDTPLGLAQHIDFEFGNIEANSTQTLDAQLALQNITFEQLLQNQLGIADISNIAPAALGLESPFFSLVLVQGDVLYFGDEDSNQGTDAETRLTELGQAPGDVFTRR